MRSTVAWVVSFGALCACSESTPDPTPRDAGVATRDAGEEPERDAGTVPVTQACARPAATPVRGDINGDGVVDVADAIAMSNHRFRSGPAPVCRVAADLDDNGRIEFGEATRITSYLMSGTYPVRPLPAGACDGAQPWPDAGCVPLAFGVQAPSSVSSSRFVATIAVQSPSLSVQGWSMSLVATGCRLRDVRDDGTVSATIWDEGRRHLGFGGHRRIDDETAVSYVVLSYSEDVDIGPSDTPIPVLRVDLEADVPASGCTPCRLSVGSGATSLGRPIDAVLVAQGYGFRPEVVTHTIDVCAP